MMEQNLNVQESLEMDSGIKRNLSVPDTKDQIDWLHQNHKNICRRIDMSTDSNNIEKKYFSISEVAEMFQVKPSLIRFWESEFDILQPTKNKKGERRFTKDDIQDLNLVYHLVKEKGFTLEGAKEHLKQNFQSTRERLDLIDQLTNLKNLLIHLRDNIKD